jgi:predicted RNase H-like nuclease (RuvC/YqgF family)
MEKIDQVIKERQEKIEYLTQIIKEDFEKLDEMEKQLAYFKDLKERMNDE